MCCGFNGIDKLKCRNFKLEVSMSVCKIKLFKRIFSYIQKNPKKAIAALVVFIFFVVYMIAKCTVGVPILNVGSALKKAPKAAFVYVDKGWSEYVCYYYVLYKNRELHTFCGSANIGEGSDIFCDGYISKIVKARSKYISKDDYEAIMNWAYEADFYSKDIILPEVWETCRMYYHNGEVRTVFHTYIDMIESSDYIFNDIFNYEEFYDFDLLYYEQIPEKRFTWWFDGKRYVPRIVIGYNDYLYYSYSGKQESEDSED